MIELKNVSYKYRLMQEQTLSNINMTIKEGEFISIIGKNGSGKSTLIKLIAGLAKPKQGTVLIDGLDANSKKNFIQIRQKVGVVFQNPENQVVFSKVYDDIAFAIRNLKLNEEESRIKKALQQVKMEDYINKNTYELSLGQKQRIAIASMLAISPKYLILDEPTTMIDSKRKRSYLSNY